MGKNTNITASQTLLAKAVYDNIAETPDELAFRRGDVLTVIEQDTNGLEGWWLCSFRGKQGIAPGNRLKILSKILEKENDTLKPNRHSWNETQNKIVLPQKQGEMYDFPNRTLEDYDVPRTQLDNNNLQIDGEANYDTPSKSRNDSGMNLSNTDQSFYDTPPTNKSTYNSSQNPHDTSLSQSLFPDIYDVPSNASNRSSVLSNISHLSNESTMTVSTSSLSNKSPQNSNPTSMCDSARSSMDISPHDFYDVPSSDPRPVNHNKQLSADSGLDLYDSPPKAKPMSSLDMEKELAQAKAKIDIQTDLEMDYDVPKTDYDVPKSKHDLLPSPNKPMENIYNVPDSEYPGQTEDDIYDVPKSNMPVKSKKLNEEKNGAKSKRGSSGVYDIPPQVTRDSVLSSKSDSSDSTDSGQRLSGCSIGSRNSDIPIYDELPLDLDAAMDLMIKLQQDVQKSVTKLSSFVSSTWRVKENLEPNLYNIKVACLGVKGALHDYLEFAQGALTNSARLPDRKLINKIHKQLCPLQQTLSQVKLCLRNLDGNDWQLSSLVTTDSLKNDDLGQIASLSKDLTTDVKKLTTLIHANSSLLFKRGADVKSLVAACDSYLHDVSNSPKTKPPIRPKPNVSPKPGNLNVQQRPLPPPPPMKERPLPPTPTEKKSLGFEDSHRNSGEFNRGSADMKRLSAEFKRLSLELKAKQENDEKSPKEIVEEYDYVQLEAKEAEEEELKNKKKEIEKDLDDKPVKESSIKNILPSSSEFPPLNTGGNIEDASVGENDFEDLKTPVNRNEMDLDSLQTPVNRNSGSFNVPSPFSQSISLEPSDKQVLFFYSGQLDTHSTLLTNAVDAFFSCIECGEPPKVFISNSKFVVVSAHKLVYIGDSLCRNISNNEIKNKIMHCANHLCDCLKVAVKATKTAALQYPSVPAVQDMVDRITSVSHAAFELKLLITQVAAL